MAEEYHEIPAIARMQSPVTRAILGLARRRDVLAWAIRSDICCPVVSCCYDRCRASTRSAEHDSACLPLACAHCQQRHSPSMAVFWKRMHSPCKCLQMLQRQCRTLNKDFGSDLHETKAAPLVPSVSSFMTSTVPILYTLLHCMTLSMTVQNGNQVHEYWPKLSLQTL